jgi:hypothetical protein
MLAGPWVASPAWAQDDKVNPQAVQAEIAAALEAINKVIPALPGMGGDGVLPEIDLKAIHGLVGEAEKLVREARRHAQNLKTVHDEEWAVGYARAALAMAQTADRLRVRLGWL